jgi:hypothetical protein
MLSLVRCLLLGHDWLVRSPERLRLRCDHCRRETKGWALNHVNGPRSPRQGNRVVEAARDVSTGDVEHTEGLSRRSSPDCRVENCRTPLQ